ncbi:MAG: hypothetical protein ACI8XO_003410 [Verrucomicrobiales bacterium]|jgi:hypothetical protein
MMRPLTLIAVLCLLVPTVMVAVADESTNFAVPKQSNALLENYCLSCHDQESYKADIRLDNLADLALDARLDLLNKMKEQLHFGHMPPKKKKAQPTDAERTDMIGWLSSELDQHNASKLEDKLRKPAYGNYVNHDKLFSGEHKDVKAFTADRRWLISEYIFDAKFNQLLNHHPFKTIDGKRQSVIGDNNRKVNITNPFLLPTNTGVRYYANATLNGGHLLTMITNAKEAATNITSYLAKRDKGYLPAFTAIMAQENQHNATLASREQFLNSFIEPVLLDIYGDKHNPLLPTFVPVTIDVPVVASGEPTKKAPFHAAQPGKEEMAIIFQSMQRLQRKDDTDAQLIEKCEREWFNFGHNERKIQSRITFLNGYMEEWRAQIVQHRYADKHKPRIYKPRDDAEMTIITDSLLKHRNKGDRYHEVIDKCMADWAEQFKQERIQAGSAGDELVSELVDQLFVKILERSPTTPERQKYASLTKSYLENLGNLLAVEKLIQTLMLRSDFVYRSEFGHGEADEHGRKMLSSRDASYAIAYALTDSSPDKPLVDAAKNGKLNTREDYRREVLRLLERRDQFYVIDEGVQRLQLTASITNTPIRKLRFFRDFFGYPKMLPIFKDNKRFGGNYDNAKGRLVGEADRLVDHILQKDKNVFEELLTTEDFYVFHSGDNEAMTASSERIRKIYEYFKDKDWQNFELEDLAKHKEFLAEVNMRGVDVKNLDPKGRRNPIREFKTAMTSFSLRFDRGQTSAAPYVSFPAHGLYNASTRTGMQLRSPEVAKFFNIQIDEWNYPGKQPAKVAKRKGMLTHPAWLIAHSLNTETDPVIRGKWVREKLLAGTVPDIPITVEAVVPEDHHNTLRSRLAKVTEVSYCWKCHVHMNPLGYAFEMYDDFGRFRTQESLEHPDNLLKKGPDKAAAHVDLRDIYKTLPVESKGYLSGTGDEKLDGDVDDAIDLAERLAKSTRVRQSIIRHAFRYFVGRNEFLSDSKTLIDADQAYLESGGSFDAVIVSLLTSDSFIYRKQNF